MYSVSVGRGQRVLAMKMSAKKKGVKKVRFTTVVLRFSGSVVSMVNGCQW